jgi:hypothetical protein
LSESLQQEKAWLSQRFERNVGQAQGSKGDRVKLLLKREALAERQWLMSVILATWEAEIRRLTVCDPGGLDGVRRLLTRSPSQQHGSVYLSSQL